MGLSKVKVIHAFPESKVSGMKDHLDNWFGIVPMELENTETGSYLACYCGAWLEPFEFDKDGEISVGAIWHQRRYKSRDE